jgi:hypothetical protein
LISTLEILESAISREDKEKAFEAVTIFLLQFTDAYGYGEIFEATFPLLNVLKDRVVAGEFEDAKPLVLALLAKMREAERLVRETAKRAPEDGEPGARKPRRAKRRD